MKLYGTENRSLARMERMRGDKAIQRLFAEGNSGFIYPFRYVYRYDVPTGTATASILVSIPKKIFKRAVKRNLLKRRTREAYRLNKSMLIPKSGIIRESAESGIEENLTAGGKIHIAFIYAAKEVLEFRNIETSIKRILTAISKEISQSEAQKTAADASL